MNSNRVFITGIGTDIGKTVVSAIVTKALGAAYWKPVQAGSLNATDSMQVKQLLGADQVIIPETYSLNEPLSPHAAAAIDNITIEIPRIIARYKEIEADEALVIEGAGGLMVPLNNTALIIDLIHALEIPVILVCSNYLGSINHTLLSIEALKSRKIPVTGIIFNGHSTPASETYILNYSGLSCLLRIPHTEVVSAAFIKNQAAALQL